MATIICANTLCEYNGENRCTANKVEMSWHSVMTVHDGRQEYLKCKTFKMDTEIQRLEKRFMEFFMKHPI